MRGVKAKRLRRAAEAVTPRAPARRLIAATGNLGTLVNDPRSTRGTYRGLKRRSAA